MQENTYDVIKELFLDTSMDYIHRVILIQANSLEHVLPFIEKIEAECIQLCYTRKFTILNTNVVKENQNRILSNDTLRAFYFEVYRSMTYSLDMKFSVQYREEVLSRIVQACSAAICQKLLVKSNPLTSHTQDFQNLCSSLYVNKETIQNYLFENPWYLVVIIGNMHAHLLIERIANLKKDSE